MTQHANPPAPSSSRAARARRLRRGGFGPRFAGASDRAMGRYLLRRLLAMVPVLLIVTVLAFLLMYLAPGDPVEALLSQGGTAPDPQLAERLRHEMGLDRPLPEQYLSWLLGVLTGDLGTSMTSGRPVAVELLGRFPATLLLTFASMGIALAIAVPLGLLAAVKRNRVADCVIRALSLLGTAVPGFLMALLLVYVFAIKAHLLPSLGSMGGVGWVLPVMTLALCEAAIYVRQVRTLAVAELDQGYVTALRLRGVSRRAILWRSILPAIAPTLLVLVGMTVGQLLGGSAIIETVFNWPGVGQYAVRQVFARDYPVIQGYALLMAVFFMLVNLAVDVAQMQLDPRVRANLRLLGRGVRNARA